MLEKGNLSKLDIVILFRGGESLSKLCNLLDYFADRELKIHLALKNIDATLFQHLRQKFSTEKITCYLLPDDGLDWGAYIRLSNKLSSEFVLFINAHTTVLSSNFELTLLSQILRCRNPKNAMCGVSASYETLRPTLCSILSSKLTAFGKFLYLYRFIRMMNSTLQPVKFPNPHIRSNGFIISRSLFLEYCSSVNFPRTKNDCYAMESGVNSLSSYIIAAGGDLKVINSKNRNYEIIQWQESNTFRTSAKSSALLTDNQTSLFETKSKFFQYIMTLYAWGKT